jgi:hypothetical protein
MPTPELQEFFAKIQGGDEGAVEAMPREMDPFLRRVIRMPLLNGRLRRAVDTRNNWCQFNFSGKENYSENCHDMHACLGTGHVLPPPMLGSNHLRFW